MLIKAKRENLWCCTLQDYHNAAQVSQPAARRVSDVLPIARDLHEGDQVLYIRTTRSRFGSFSLLVSLATVVCLAGPSTVDVRLEGTDTVVGTRKDCLRELPPGEKIDQMMRSRNEH